MRLLRGEQHPLSLQSDPSPPSTNGATPVVWQQGPAHEGFPELTGQPERVCLPAIQEMTTFLTGAAHRPAALSCVWALQWNFPSGTRGLPWGHLTLL